ncbi:unnamed protein product, partial [Gongylonema pulchrum]
MVSDVKNWESQSPFAFIQFADIQSVANWGRTIVSNKIWISEVPPSCSADYLREKMRVSFTDTFSEVIYDPRYREALLLFVNNDSAQRAFSLIKMRQIAFWNADEKRDVHVPVDYCSEKLHDYFVDRKFPLNGTGPSAYGNAGISACPGSGSSLALASTSSLLAPPPDPPSHLRDFSTRSRRRRERARRNDFSASSSSTSTTSSDSDSSSRSSTPDRRRNERSSHSRSIQRSHRD